MLSQPTLWNSIGLLILRVGVGGFMASHGIGKVRMLVSGEFEQFGDPIGIGVLPSVVLVAFAEFVCAMLIVLGLATRLAAVPIVIAMGVAAFAFHGADPLSAETAAIRFFAGESETWFSKEPALLFLIPFLALAFTGAGRFSIDHLIVCRWSHRHGRGAGGD